MFQHLHISQNVRTFACDNRILKLLHLIISIYSLNLLLWKKIKQNKAVELTYSQLKNVLQSVQQALASINDQEVELTLFIGIKPKHREGSWKALAEAHLRERVRNPHDYRALSIELYAMEKAGYDWRRDFSSYGELSRFLSSLYL